MNETSSELISADFDSEATATEREAVEVLLRDSEEARGERDEINLLSATLRSLPVHNAPDDFAATILNRIAELPAHSEPEDRATLAQPSGGRSVAIWLAAAGSLAAVAVVVMLSAGRPPGIKELADNATSAKQQLPEERQATPRVAPKAPAPGNEFDMADRMGGKTAREPRAFKQDGNAGGIPEAAKGKPVPSGPVLMADDLEEELKGLNPKIGEILKIAATENNRVVMVEVTVVDVRKTLGAMQVLLARHARVPGKKPDDAKDIIATDETRSELNAVYVQTSRQHLVTALAEMQKRELLRQVTTQSSVPTSEIVVDESQRDARQAATRTTLAQAITAAEKKIAKPKVSVPPQAGGAEAPKKEPRQLKSPATSTKRDASEVKALALSLALRGNQSRKKTRTARDGESPATDNKKNENTPQSPDAPVRVLFVLREQ